MRWPTDGFSRPVAECAIRTAMAAIRGNPSLSTLAFLSVGLPIFHCGPLNCARAWRDERCFGSPACRFEPAGKTNKKARDMVGFSPKRLPAGRTAPCSASLIARGSCPSSSACVTLATLNSLPSLPGAQTWNFAQTANGNTLHDKQDLQSRLFLCFSL